MTLEIPDTIFRRAKAKAVEERIPLRQFVSEAVAEKLESMNMRRRGAWYDVNEHDVGRPIPIKRNPMSPTRERMKTKLVGRLRHLRKETARINARIEREFEAVEPEEQV